MDFILKIRANLFILLLILSLKPSLHTHEIMLPEYLAYESEVTRNATKDISKELNIAPSSSGGSMPYDVEKISLGFYAYHNANIDEARKMIVKATERLIKEMNANQKIRPYLREYPVKANRAQISISFMQKNNTHRTKDSISYALQVKNEISYSVYNPASKCLETVMEEPYEDALEIVKKAN